MEFVLNFMDKIGICDEAKKYLAETADMILKNDEAKKLLFSCETDYFGDEDGDYTDKTLDMVSVLTGVHIYTVHFVFLLCMAERLKRDYMDAGLEENLYWDLMRDLKYKLDECYAVHKIWGTFVFSWFRDHYRMKRFALGRFQYEEKVYDGEPYRKGNIVLNPGDVVYNFHIPSSGSIKKEIRLDSYKKAFRFFAKEGQKYIIFMCFSYLLYPENKTTFPKDSNLYSFMEDFDIISVRKDDSFHDAWRIFNTDDVSDLSRLPQDTTLQKNYIERLKNGGTFGLGTGIIIFDGEKIIR